MCIESILLVLMHILHIPGGNIYVNDLFLREKCEKVPRKECSLVPQENCRTVPNEVTSCSTDIFFLIGAFDLLVQYTDIYFLNVFLVGWRRQLLAQQALLCAESVIASVCESNQPIIRIFKIHTL